MTCPLPSERSHHAQRLAAVRGWRTVLAVVLCTGLAVAGARAAEAPAAAPALGPATATGLDPVLASQVRDLVLARVVGPATSRAEVILGALDPRLRLAACGKVEPFLPNGTRLRGAARVGLRCLEGPARWSVYLPVTVQVYGPGLVAAGPLPAGHVLAQADVREAEILLSDSRSVAVTDLGAAVGRTLSQPLAAGEPVRPSGLKSRQWFAAGDTVEVRATGGGFAIVASGEALANGLEGQPVRVRTGSGKIVTGQPAGDRVVEIAL